LPPRLRAHHLALLFHNLVTAGRTQEARAALDETRTAVLAHDRTAGRFVLELGEAGLAYVDGEFDRALALAESSLRTILATDDVTRANVARQWRCEVLNLVDRLEDSLQCGIDNIADAQRDRQGWALHIFELGRARQLLQIGQLNDAAALLDERFSPETADQVVGAMDAAGVVALSRVATHRGDKTQAEKATEIALVMIDQDAPSVRRHGLWLLALQALARSQPDRALEWLRRDGSDERMSIVPLFPMDGGDEVRLVRIALAAGDNELADYAADSASSRSRLNPDAQCLAAVAAHTRGLINDDRNELDQAIGLFESGPRRMALASALEDFAGASLRHDQKEQAIDTFGRALEVFTQAGATWDAGRIRGRLRAMGVRRRLVAPRRPRSGWDSITDSELAVARLVAQGLTNRETAERLFVSRHTVSGQLRSIFAKLNINSRVELARIASAHGFD